MSQAVSCVIAIYESVESGLDTGCLFQSDVEMVSLSMNHRGRSLLDAEMLGAWCEALPRWLLPTIIFTSHISTAREQNANIKHMCSFYSSAAPGQKDTDDEIRDTSSLD